MEGEFLLYSAKFEVYVFRRLVLHKHFTDHGHNAIITEKSTSLIFADVKCNYIHCSLVPKLIFPTLLSALFYTASDIALRN